MIKKQLITICFIFFSFMLFANSDARLEELTSEDKDNISVNLVKKYESIKLNITRLEAKIDEIKSSIERNKKTLNDATLMVDELGKKVADDTIEKRVKKQLKKELEGYKEKILFIETQLNLLNIQLDIQSFHKKEELEEMLKEKNDMELKYPFLVIKGPTLQSIEVINIQGGNRLDLALGEKVRLKAIPHSYDSEGNDHGDEIINFNPRWSAEYGIFSPEIGAEVTYILTGEIGRIAQFFICVSQENAEGKTIKSDIWVNVMRNKKIENK